MSKDKFRLQVDLDNSYKEIRHRVKLILPWLQSAIPLPMEYHVQALAKAIDESIVLEKELKEVEESPIQDWIS